MTGRLQFRTEAPPGLGRLATNNRLLTAGGVTERARDGSRVRHKFVSGLKAMRPDVQAKKMATGLREQLSRARTDAPGYVREAGRQLRGQVRGGGVAGGPGTGVLGAPDSLRPIRG